MATVVFFRAVNVGLHQRFQPSALAKELSAFGVVNVGAAGTFVVKENISAAKLRDEILRRLSFKSELMICPAKEILELADDDPSAKMPAGKEITLFVSVLQKAPRSAPPLPIEYPAGEKWQVRIIKVIGQFVLSLRRPGPKNLYANAVVEKHFGLPATTRGWNTLTAVGKVLAK